MIQVGINENVLLVGASVNEKNSLELKFEELGNVKSSSIFDELQTATVENDARATTLLLFPFKKPSGVRAEGKTEDEILDLISKDMLRTKNQLTQILELWLTEDKISWDPYYGTGVTKENHREMLLNNDVLAKMFANYAAQFITQVTPFLGDRKSPFRLKLVRQSAEKHFATLPGLYLKDNPFVELMEVPLSQTKVKFTKWELDNKYNDGTPVARPSATEEMAADVPSGTSSVFGHR